MAKTATAVATPARKPRKKTSPRERLADRMSLLIKMLSKTMKLMSRFPDVEDALQAGSDAKLALIKMDGLASVIPDDATPGRPKVNLVGESVCIKEEKRADYDGVVPPEAFDTMKVTAIRKRSAACVTSTGATLFLPVKDLTVI